MRVVVWTDSDRFAGTEQHCLDLAGGLKEQGVSVRLGCCTNSPLAAKALAEGVPLLHLGGRAAAVSSARRLSALLSTGDVDIVHAHNGRCTLAGCLATRQSGRGKLVATQHFIDPARVRRRGPAGVLSRRVHRWTTTRVDRWISVSDAVGRAMLARGDALPENLRIVPNGARVPRSDEPDRLAARELLGLRCDVPLLVCVARLEPEKGHGVLLNALYMLARESVGVHTVLLGEGSEEARIRTQIRALGLGGSVQMVGQQPHIGVWLQAADVLVLASPQEPFGLVLLEAMSRGVPVVGANCGGPPEILQAGGGLLFEAGDGRDLARKLTLLLQDQDERERLGRQGRSSWLRRYSVGEMVTSTLRVYSELL